MSLAVEGGRPPYAVTWSGAQIEGLGPHQVCPMASVAIDATVTDTPPDDDEFTRAPAKGSARIELDVEPCMDPPEPEDACALRAKASAFTPSPKWSFGEADVFAQPLVANLTDDNADGAVDARDTPDVVIITQRLVLDAGLLTELIALDGATGREHFRVADVPPAATPAIGDLDGDGRPEIVVTRGWADDVDDMANRRLTALDAGGKQLWSVPFSTSQNRVTGPITIEIADLDADGSPEIIAALEVFDAMGQPQWVAELPDSGPAVIQCSPVAVDLDGDGYLEVMFGTEAYRHDGIRYFRNGDVAGAIGVPPEFSLEAAFSAAADLDRDGKTEIVTSVASTLFVIDSDGTTRERFDSPVPGGLPCPPAIATLEAGGPPVILHSDGEQLRAFAADLTVLWSAAVSDSSRPAAPSAFDFDGDGTAEVVYADEKNFWMFDGRDGHVLLSRPHASETYSAYPAVADVDNDGSADLLLVAGGNGAAPLGLTVLSDPSWVPARRILNQHAYHVTNVDETGTIPPGLPADLGIGNTFRVQVRIDPKDGTPCLDGKRAEPITLP